MKSTVQLVLVIFIFFLSAPTIVSLIEKKSDTSMFFTFSEEELAHKDFKLIKNDCCFCGTVDTNILSAVRTKIFSKVTAQLKKPSKFIFSPPPNM